MSGETMRIGFGGGCHWCTEAVFQALAGVNAVAQGFVRSEPPHDSWSEAVIATFDPSIIDLGVLIEIHLRTHSSMSNHKMRHKYRSAVYTFDNEQNRAAKSLISELQSGFDKPLVTLVLPYLEFRYSDQRFHDYYAKNPERSFCRTYIDPKLRLLRDRYSAQLRT